MKTNRLIRRSQQALHHALDLLFPPHCTGCKRSGHVLCPSCFTAIQPLTPPLCQHCSKVLSPNTPYNLCYACHSHPLHLSGLRAVSTYQDPLRSCIHSLKYEGNTRLAEPLGLLLAKSYRAYGMRADVIVPVPLHSARERQRGYNHASLLAEVCAQQVGWLIQPVERL